MNEGESSLIRVLPACLKDPLPSGWDRKLEGYVIESMPVVEHPAAVSISLRTTEPDILLVDGDFPNINLLSLTREAHLARPGVAVIVFATDHSPSSVHQAMLAGVEEYLPKPLEAARLHDTLLAIAGHKDLRQVTASTEIKENATQGRVVGVFSGKGGLGKTTIATNLATLTAKAQKTTGLVGFESGDAAVLLNIQPRLGLFDMVAAMTKRLSTEEDNSFSAEWMKQFATAHRSGIQYWTWKGTSSQVGAEVPGNFITTFLEACRATFAYTFIDFPVLADEEFTSLLPLLDVVLVVSSTSDLLALRSTKNLLDMVTPEYHRRVRIIINQADPLDMISQNDFEEALEYRAVATLPNLPQIASGAINMGSPIVATQQKNQLSDSFTILGEQLFKLPRDTTETKPVKRFGLF